MARTTCNENGMSTESTVRTAGNNCTGNFTQTIPKRRPRNLVNIPNYDSRQFLDDFDFVLF